MFTQLTDLLAEIHRISINHNRVTGLESRLLLSKIAIGNRAD